MRVKKPLSQKELKLWRQLTKDIKRSNISDEHLNTIATIYANLTGTKVQLPCRSDSHLWGSRYRMIDNQATIQLKKQQEAMAIARKNKKKKDEKPIQKETTTTITTTDNITGDEKGTDKKGVPEDIQKPDSNGV